MSHDHHSSPHSVRRIVLPSGRSIEVVRFHDSDAPARGLHVCPECGCTLVQPIAWNQISDSARWELTLECPNCWWSETGSYAHREVSALEEHLDDGVAALVRDLQRLTHANMADETDRFVAALRADFILPEDF